MTELVAALFRIAFLVGLWLFIFFVANVIRTDLIGQTVTEDEIGLSRRERRQRRRQPAGPQRAVVIAGSSTGVEIPLADVVTIGRASSQTLTIDDDFASTKHAIIRKDGAGNWIVEDLHSTNGTFVNGTQVFEPTLISTGDLVRIGRTQIRLEE